ncbi:MAG: FAD-dependent oxidoreductase, partial [Clostridiales Family XIII bacterium]|nr:FAD-dependent oxidoreductase [Clostridiales Family XIII bacterium]
SADAVCVGRGLIADPAFPRKVRDGASKLIRPCIACNQNCMDRVFSGAGLGCALNADAGRESVAGRSRKQDASAPARGKRVRVVGGGIAGCEAAIRLAESGCRVRLSEQADVLGGHLRTASAWDTGSLFKKFLAYQEHMLRRLCVDVETGRSVTGGELRDAREDLIVIATGSVVAPFGPEAKVFEGRALPATDAWAEGFIPGKDIVIIGGGALGVETAVMLARRSAASPELIRFLTLHDAESPERISELARRCGGRRITVVERSGRIGTGIGNSTRWIAMKLLRLYGVRLLADTTGFRFTPQGVEAETRDGVLMLEADTILAAAGFRSVLPRGPAVGGDPRRTVVIGDADRPGGIGKAIAQAAAVARGFVENA